MFDFAEEKAKARRVLHEILRVPAYLFRSGDTNLDPIEIHVRPHIKFAEMGDIKGTSFAYSERETVQPKMLFWRDEIEPKRFDVVTLKDGTAYRVDSLEPPDGQTVRANIVALSKSDAENYDRPS